MHRATRVGIPALLSAVFAAGCIGFSPAPAGPLSWGGTSDGVLRGGVRLADSGAGFVRARPGEETRFGTPELVRAIERAAAAVVATYPGTAPLRVGDLSYPMGGQHPRHRSHRTGRDVDVVFYVTDAAGRSQRGRGWLAFDRFGVAREAAVPEGGTASNDLFFFDDARNWAFVRALIADPQSNVQWIFCSRGLKARLLAYAAVHETDPEVLFRASWVLHQPSRGRPHNDHFHIRIACTPEQRVQGCQDAEPIWPWLRKDLEKPDVAVAASTLTDDALVYALMSEDGRIAPTDDTRIASRTDPDEVAAATVQPD